LSFLVSNGRKSSGDAFAFFPPNAQTTTAPNLEVETLLMLYSVMSLFSRNFKAAAKSLTFCSPKLSACHRGSWHAEDESLQ
jgi:hypothetical protein